MAAATRSPDPRRRGKMIGQTKFKSAAAVLGVLVVVALATGLAWAVDPSRLVNAEKDPNSWLSYNGTYHAWRYSSLGQINRANVGNRAYAWTVQAGRPASGPPGDGSSRWIRRRARSGGSSGPSAAPRIRRPRRRGVATRGRPAAGAGG